MKQSKNLPKYTTHESSQTSNQSSANCQVKSRYIGSWDQRSIKVSLQDNSLYLSNSNSKKVKTYHLDEIDIINDPKQKLLKLSVPSGRLYQIKSNNQVTQTLNYIKYFKTYKLLIGAVQEMATPLPKKLNYFATIRSQSFNENYIPEHRSSIIIPNIKKSQRIIQRRKSYIIDEDWIRDTKKGGLVFINEDKKSMITKMISYIVKRVISTGSFMGISFPTFAMKPQTILQTYCKCLGSAPLIFDKINSDPIQRIKAFNAVILTISLQFNDIQKPFNPTLGETFQGQIGGYPVYAEQISHHPPISSFLMDGKDYILHGTLELNANLGLNSAIGIFYGQVVVQFDDGGVVKGRMPSGMLNGMIFGETKFGPQGAVYSYDPINHLVSSYQVKQKDIMIGNIGILKGKSYQKFLSMIQSKGKQKYEKYKNFGEKQYQKILSRMEVVWTSNIKYDGKMYLDYLKKQNLPIKLTQNISQCGQKLLLSDSSFRSDIKLRQQRKMQQSQDQKEKIQDVQRQMRKLRERGKGLNHRKSIN